MNKYFIPLLCAIFLCVSLGLNSKVSAGKTDSMFISPTPTPESFADVEKLELDRNEITLPCPPGRRPPEGKTCDDDFLIKVKTTALNPKNSEQTYQYTVSGGRIKGVGAEVVWDLSGVRAGTYTITAAVNDGAGFFGKAQTETLRIRECECRFVDVCPVIRIAAARESVKAGETVTLTAEVAGISADDMTFNWTVSAGEIEEGQGTKQIKIKTTREMAEMSLTATLQISGASVASICETSASETVSITK